MGLDFSIVSQYDTIMNKTMLELEEKMALVKESITRVGHMHPGTLSVQKRSGGGEYHQLSFTHAGKGHTLYVRPENVEEVSEAVANYRKFRELTNCWIELEIAFAKCRREETSGSSHK